MKIVIDCGHGGKDGGASSGSFIEKDLNLKTGLAVGGFLEKYIAVCYTRNNDVYETLRQKSNEVNDSGADLGISVHFNAGGGDGFEGYSWDLSGKGFEIGKCIEREILKLGQNSRGMKDGSRFHMVRETKIPFVLCEIAFVDNAKDMEMFNSNEELIAVGEAIGRGILNYLGISFVIEDETTPTLELLYTVQVGAYGDRNNAIQMVDELKTLGIEAFIKESAIY